MDVMQIRNIVGLRINVETLGGHDEIEIIRVYVIYFFLMCNKKILPPY